MKRGVQEVYWVVGHLTSLEEHAYEAGSGELAKAVADLRREVMREVLFKGRGEEYVRAWWCAVKHACSLLVHLEECVAQGVIGAEVALRVHDELLKLLDMVVGGDTNERGVQEV